MRNFLQSDVDFAKAIVSAVKKIFPPNKINEPYESLSPIDDANTDSSYFRALAWALKNRKKKRISNIAITGPYGSGKSSFIKSFQKHYRQRGIRYLNLSLATFRDNDKKLKMTPETLRLIELSILQQLFYRENDSTMRDSRFKKIKKFGKTRLLFTSLWWAILMVAFINVLQPYFIQSVFKDFPFSESTCNWIYYGSYSILFIGLMNLLWSSVRIISAIQINHVKFQNAEIKIDEKFNKSILNHYLDEILYFFEVTKYNVVVIEDLDRFESTEIFTKMREINLLLNTAKKTEQLGIVFVYAVRDDLFLGAGERTKFFDFIIPVIPIIHSSNSSDVLRKRNVDNDYKITEALIGDISLFINDMRLLNNVMNEFQMYRENLDKNLSVDQMLAIILYKNVYPPDFTLLTRDEGILYNAMASKSSIVATATDELTKQITHERAEIERIGRETLSDVLHLRMLYLYKIVEFHGPVEYFLVQEKAIQLKEMLEDENFELLRSRAALIYNSRQGRIPPPSFEDIESSLQAGKYLQRKQDIESSNQNKQEEKRKLIRRLETEKVRLHNMKLAELLRRTNEEVPVSEEVRRQGIDTRLIELLVKKGHITENYLHYISVFHEGTITRQDNAFIVGVKSSLSMAMDYKLGNADQVVERLSPADFETHNVLNFDLANALISRPESEKRNLFFELLSNGTDVSFNFIDSFIFKASDPRLFMNLLCHSWPELWKYVSGSQPEFRKKEYLRRIVESAAPVDLRGISEQSNLVQDIVADPLFLEISPDTEAIKRAIDTLEIDFTRVDLQSCSDDLAKHIYMTGRYVVNVDMLWFVLSKYGNFEIGTFYTGNYNSILGSRLDRVVRKVNADLNAYVHSVYTSLPNNKAEPVEALVKLLNRLDREPFEAVLQYTQTRIPVQSLSDPAKRRKLLQFDRATRDWDGLFTVYQHQLPEETLAPEIVEFLVAGDNAKILSEAKQAFTDENEESVRLFWRTLLEYDAFPQEPYEYMLRSVPRAFDDFRTQQVKVEKVQQLIVGNVLNLTEWNYQSLRTNHWPENIALLEHKRVDYLANRAPYALGGSDVFEMLERDGFEPGEKSTILSDVSEATILSRHGMLALIARLVTTYPAFEISAALLWRVIMSPDVETTMRLRVFNLQHMQVPSESMSDFFGALGEPYSDLNIPEKRTIISPTSEHRRFTEILRGRGVIASHETQDGDIEIVRRSAG